MTALVTSVSLLIINPNSTVPMTDALKSLVSSLGYSNVSLLKLEGHRASMDV